MKCKMAGRMIRWALVFALLLMPAVCHAQAQHPLVGTWRFAGGAEVLGYGLQILEDGTCILMNTDDFDHFPPEKLLELRKQMKKFLKSLTVIQIISVKLLRFVPLTKRLD